MFELSLKNTNEFDKIYMRFSKYVLAVHSKGSNFAVISELGQLPLINSILTSCINFWLHTIQSHTDSLVKRAYQEQMNGLNDKCAWLHLLYLYCMT